MDRIERREGVRGGRPVLAGTKIEVVQVATLVRDTGLTPEEIVKAYHGVEDVEMVYSALDYYDSHSEEMDRIEREREEAFERLDEFLDENQTADEL